MKTILRLQTVAILIYLLFHHDVTTVVVITK